MSTHLSSEPGPRWARWLCGPPLSVYFDEDCGICQATVRALRPLDRGRRLTFLGYDDDLPLPPGLDREALEARRAVEIVVHVRSTGAVLGGARGMLQILAALPLLRFVVWLGRLPGLSHLLEAGYRAVARNRRRISAALGLNACRVRLPG
jgi:predicted DCC family thiol-disulfide oxidoreductase YuxK